MKGTILNRPKEVDITKLDKATAKYVVNLEEMVGRINSDPIVRLYSALKTQLGHISGVLETNSIIDISDSDDKGFDRTIKLSTESKKIVENIKYLEGLIDPKEEVAPVAEEGTVESMIRGRIK